MRIVLCWAVLAMAAGCQKQWHGTASVYVFNATTASVEVKGTGRTDFGGMVRPDSGRLFEGIVAGEYKLSQYPNPEKPTPTDVTLVKEHFYLMNVNGLACFARADVVGMYRQGKQPVRVLETYMKDTWVDIVDDIRIVPGQSLPASLPTRNLVFQRLAPFPCDLSEDDTGDDLRAYLKNLR